MSNGEHGELGDSEARTKLMREVLEQMSAIEADFGQDFEILNVITVLRIKSGDEISMRLRNADTPPLEAIGLLEVAKDFVKGQMTSEGE